MSRCLLAFPLILLPAAAFAQGDPSFDCDDSDTRTELAICASPELSRLEVLTVEAYEGLAEVIGRREARAIADEFLVRRQACEGDPDCIAERLLISMEAFNQRAGRTTDLAGVEAILRGTPTPPEVVEAEPPVAELPAAEPAIVAVEPAPPAAPPVRPELDLAAAAPSEAAEPEVPLAAQVPWPATDLPTSEELSDAIADAELASSDGAEAATEAAAEAAAPVAPAAPAPDGQAAFDTPLSWAFMDLTREQRSALQARLAEAGILQDDAAGRWTGATRTALESVAEEAGDGFDLSTQSGAALLLDYVGSEAFAARFGIEAASAEPEIAAPVAGTDW